MKGKLGHHGTGSMTLRAARDAGDAPLWVCAFDADEYFTPIDPWTSVPSLFARYEAAGQHHLHLPKVGFGDSHDSELKQCVDGPLIARFTQYGEETGSGKTCFHSSVLPPPPPPGGIDAFVDANGTMVEGVHFFTGLTQSQVLADMSGPRALVLSHFKPQSLAEFERRYAWNKYQQAKFPNITAGVVHEAARHPEHVRGTYEGTYEALVKSGSGAAYAGHLHRAIRLCAVDGSTFASQLRACGEPGQRLCRLDCRAARRRQGCPVRGRARIQRAGAGAPDARPRARAGRVCGRRRASADPQRQLRAPRSERLSLRPRQEAGAPSCVGRDARASREHRRRGGLRDAMRAAAPRRPKVAPGVARLVRRDLARRPPRPVVEDPEAGEVERPQEDSGARASTGC